MSLNFKTPNKNYNSPKFSIKHKANSSPSFAAWTTTAVALGTLGLLAFVASPDISNDASAAPLNLSATVDVVLSLAIQDLSSSPIDTVSAEINNSASGMTNTAKVIASTNNANGYTLTLADNDNITDLAPYNSTTGTYDTSGPTIAPISGDMSLASFSPNTWGYAVVYSNTNTSAPTPPTTFSPMSTTPVELYTEVEGPGTGYHYFTAAAKVGDLLPGNTYEDKVTFSLTATPAPTPAFFAITNMQDMDATICNSVDTPASSVTNVTADDGSDYVPGGTIVPSHTLTDARDNQQYTVRKLADGNCWMTENLRYGATTGGAARAYTSADADKSNNVNTTNMANLTASRICTTNSSCKTPGNVNMFSSSGDNYTMPYIMIYQANDVANYDGRTKYGVLYNYCAATGGTVCNASAMSTDAPGSVCPKGWKLPGMTASATGTGAVTDGSVKTYNNLANSYGYGNTQAGMNGMFSSPINLLRAGRASNGSLGNRSATGGGYYWSSTKYTSTINAYYLYLYDLSGGYIGLGNYYRYNGNSARCVSGS